MLSISIRFQLFPPHSTDLFVDSNHHHLRTKILGSFDSSRPSTHTTLVPDIRPLTYIVNDVTKTGELLPYEARRVAQ